MNVAVSVTAAGGTTSVRAPAAVTTGRDPTNDVVIDDPLVSRVHARVTHDGNGWVLADGASRNGTFVDGFRVGTVTIDRTVTVRLGHAVDGPWLQVTPTEMVPDAGGAAPAGRVSASPGTFTAVHDARAGLVRIGRAADNDVVVDDLLVSRHHAELHRDAAGRSRVVDLGSHNGTFVNGQPLADTPARRGDVGRLQVTVGDPERMDDFEAGGDVGA